MSYFPNPWRHGKSWGRGRMAIVGKTAAVTAFQIMMFRHASQVGPSVIWPTPPGTTPYSTAARGDKSRRTGLFSAQGLRARVVSRTTLTRAHTGTQPSCPRWGLAVRLAGSLTAPGDWWRWRWLARCWIRVSERKLPCLWVRNRRPAHSREVRPSPQRQTSGGAVAQWGHHANHRAAEALQ